MKKSFYITTPLYYVNDEPHIGHAYTTVLADVLAGYHRLFGEDVHFLTGTDEHGQKVADASALLDRTPLEHCDITSKRFNAVWDKLGIKYDDFIRTTEPRHEKVVKDILTQIYDNGDIYKKEYEGWYSVFEEQFFTEKDLVDGKDPIGRRPVELIKETNYFFKMSKYQDWLIERYESDPDSVVPSFRRNEVLGFLKKPLNDLCISRPKSRLSWGIEIPWDSDFVTYVWFDALLNYYTATLSPPEGKEVEWPADYHLIGKDILTTHSIYWPSMLHAAGLEPPKHILAHGWWMSDDASKMSKSKGNVVKPLDLADVYGSEPFRYFLMRDMVLGQDANFSEAAVVKRLNSDLANDLGNLLNRITKLITNNLDSTIPNVEWDDEDKLIELAGHTATKVHRNIDKLQIHAAIEETMQFVRAINRDIANAAPWNLVKTDLKAAGEVLTKAAESIRVSCVMLSPIMPELTSAILARLGVKAENLQWDDSTWGSSLFGNTVTHGEALFPRYKMPKVEETQKQPKKKQDNKKEQKADVGESLITFDQFKGIDLRTAKILEAEPVDKSDKLMKLQIDLGDEKRQLVAGVKEFYSAEDLVGKTVIVVANLKPAKIFGIQSNGMMLAMRDGDNLTIVSPDSDMKPGIRLS